MRRQRARRCAADAMLPIVALASLIACASRTEVPESPVHLRYVGSSTVANFLRDAQQAYGAVRFDFDTREESDGGERAILAGEADLAGIARPPSTALLAAGVVSTMIGRDAIAVIVNPRNSVRQLSLAQAAAVFRGDVRRWSELGGPDLPVDCIVPTVGAATRSLFRSVVLGGEPFGPCREVTPDQSIRAAVAASDGAVGTLSFSFLAGADSVRAIALDGEAPSVANFDYPIARPLHLLWREDAPAAAAFVRWVLGADGQQVMMRRFVGVRVVGGIEPAPARAADTGTLVVFTETYPAYDGGIYYYPHRPYEIRTREGDPVRRVANHLSDNDESPTRVELPAGTYLIRAPSRSGGVPEFLVTIRPGETTEVDVVELAHRSGR